MGALKRAVGPLAGRVIGVYGSGGAPWHHLALAATLGASVRPVRAEDVAAGALEELDAFVVPGGGATAMAGLLAPLGEAGADAIRRWVAAGGTYVSSCAGSVLPLALTDEADAALPTARCLRMVSTPLANPGDATLGGLASPGVGRIKVAVDTRHPLAAHSPAAVEMVHYNGPLFDLHGAPEGVQAFAWPLGATAAFTAAERFLPNAGAELGTTDDPGVLERCIASGAATALQARVERGRVVLFGSHPEFGLGPLLLGWGFGAALLGASLARHPDDDPLPEREARRRPGPGWAVRPEHSGRTAHVLASRAATSAREAARRFGALAERDLGDWLDPDRAASFHGRGARDAWRPDALAAVHAATAVADDLEALAPDLDTDALPWLDDAPRPDQDFGAMGLVQALDRILAMQGAAADAATAPAGRPAHAYDLFDSHPFHLTVGSYLSAAGLTAAALLAVVVLAARHGAAAPASSALLWADDRARDAAFASSEGIRS